MKLYTWEHDKKTQSFTIIELLVVIAIIGTLAGMVIGVGRSARERAKRTRAEAMIASLEVAIAMYKTDTGSYPPNSSGSLNPIQTVYDRLTNTAHATDIDGWRGPYMEFKDDDIVNNEIVDPWRRGYWYDSDPNDGVVPNNRYSFDLWSIGPDRVNNTSDDITNW